MIKLYLYKKAIKRDIEDVKQQLCAATGINPQSSHRPHGFGAVVAFDFGDIYIDDYLNIQLNDELKNDIDNCLIRLLKDDYGNVTEDEKDDNVENRYFGGGDIIGRYEIAVGVIEITVMNKRTDIVLLKGDMNA